MTEGHFYTYMGRIAYSEFVTTAVTFTSTTIATHIQWIYSNDSTMTAYKDKKLP